MENGWRVALGVGCLVLVNGLQLLIPLVIKRAVDALTAQHALARTLLISGLLILAIALAVAILRYVWRHLIFGHSRYVERELRHKLYKHLQKLSLSFFARTKSGDLMARSVNDLDAVRFAVGMGVVALNDGVLLGMAAVGFMLWINVKLTLIALIPMPATILASRILTQRMHRSFQQIQKTFGDVTERVREAFSSIRLLQAYARESWEVERVRAVGERFVSENVRLARAMALFFPIMILFTNLSLTVVLWFGGRMAILGGISMGDFVAFISYLNMLTWPMMALGWVTNLVQRGSASMMRINHVLEETPEIQDRPAERFPTSIRGRIEIRDLRFGYPSRSRRILDGVSMSIEPGENVALVGRTGSGKTTLVRLLARILDPPEGSILFDGVPIHSYPLAVLRKAAAVVPQNAMLFSDTVYNNVVFGREELGMDRIEACLEAAEFSREVREFPRGLQTLIGEKGITLSGGQRQRLALARALLEDPPILILDNGLSMVDATTEHRILDHLSDMRREKTSIWISHRVSTLRRVHRIFVLDGGRIAEQGDHETLLAEGTVYPDLYRLGLLSNNSEA